LLNLFIQPLAAKGDHAKEAGAYEQDGGRFGDGLSITNPSAILIANTNTPDMCGGMIDSMVQYLLEGLPH